MSGYFLQGMASARPVQGYFQRKKEEKRYNDQLERQEEQIERENNRYQNQRDWQKKQYQDQQQQQQRQQNLQYFKTGLNTAVKNNDPTMAANVMEKYPETTSRIYGSEKYGEIAKNLINQEQPGYTQAAKTAQNMAADRNYSDQEKNYWQDNYGHISDSPNALFNLDNAQQGAGNENGTGGGQQGNKNYLTEQGYDYRFLPEEHAQQYMQSPNYSIIADKENDDFYYLDKTGSLSDYNSGSGSNSSKNNMPQVTLSPEGDPLYRNDAGYLVDDEGAIYTDKKGRGFIYNKDRNAYTRSDANTSVMQNAVESEEGNVSQYTYSGHRENLLSLDQPQTQQKQEGSWFKPWTWGDDSVNANRPTQTQRDIKNNNYDRNNQKSAMQYEEAIHGIRSLYERETGNKIDNTQDLINAIDTFGKSLVANSNLTRSDLYNIKQHLSNLRRR